MIPVRRNIDTDELIMWLDPSSPLSYKLGEYSVSIASKGKNQFAGTTNFTNTGPSVTSRVWNDTAAGINKATVANEPLVIDPDGNTATTAFIETENPEASSAASPLISAPSCDQELLE